MFSWNKIINALKRSRGNVNPFTTFKPFGWKCCKTIGSYVSCVFIEIWSTWEVWRALKKLELLSATPRATLTHLSCSPNFPRASYLDERTLTYEPIVIFHKYTTPWQLCYNRDKENLFHFTCSWKTSGQKHKLTYSSEQKWENSHVHALRWIGIFCSDSKKEGRVFIVESFL